MKSNYGVTPVAIIAKKLGRTEDAIKGRAYAFGLVDENTVTRAKWTKEEISFLKKNINKKSNEEMAQYLGRSIASVAAKLSDLKLKKAFPLRRKDGKKVLSKVGIAASITINVVAIAYLLVTLLI